MVILHLQHISFGTTHISRFNNHMWVVATILESAGLDYVSGRGAFIERVGMTCKDIEGGD